MSWLATAIVCVGVIGNPVPQCTKLTAKTPLVTEAACKDMNATLLDGLGERLKRKGFLLLSAKVDCTEIEEGDRT